MDFERRGMTPEAECYKVKVGKDGFVDGLGRVNNPDNEDFLEKLRCGEVEVVRGDDGKITEVIFTKKYLQKNQQNRERILKNRSIFSQNLSKELAKDEKDKAEPKREGVKQTLFTFLEENKLKDNFEIKKITRDYIAAGVHRCMVFDKIKNETFVINGDLEKIKKVILSHAENIIEEKSEDFLNKEANA